jgi:hypothetical protein
MSPPDVELLSRASETARMCANSAQSCAYTALQVAKPQRLAAKLLGY